MVVAALPAGDPRARVRLLRQKAIVAALLSLATLLVLPLVAVVLGTLVYGAGDYLSPTGESLPYGTALVRIALAVAYLAIHLLWVAGVASLLSVVTDAPLGAVGGAVLVSILSQILDTVDALGSIRNVLPTHDVFAFADLLTLDVDGTDLARGVLSALVWCHRLRRHGRLVVPPQGHHQLARSAHSVCQPCVHAGARRQEIPHDHRGRRIRGRALRRAATGTFRRPRRRSIMRNVPLAAVRSAGSARAPGGAGSARPPRPRRRGAARPRRSTVPGGEGDDAAALAVAALRGVHDAPGDRRPARRIPAPSAVQATQSRCMAGCRSRWTSIQPPNPANRSTNGASTAVAADGGAVRSPTAPLTARTSTLAITQSSSLPAR